MVIFFKYFAETTIQTLAGKSGGAIRGLSQNKSDTRRRHENEGRRDNDPRDCSCPDSSTTMKDKIDRKMSRTSWQRLSTPRILAFLGLVILLCLVLFDQRRYGKMATTDETTRISEKKQVVRDSLHAPDVTESDLPIEPTSSSPFSEFVTTGNIPLDNRPSLPPLEMLQAYVSEHSEESLWKDWQANNTDRRVSTYPVENLHAMACQVKFHVRLSQFLLFEMCIRC